MLSELEKETMILLDRGKWRQEFKETKKIRPIWFCTHSLTAAKSWSDAAQQLRLEETYWSRSVHGRKQSLDCLEPCAFYGWMTETPRWKVARARICTLRLCLLFQSIARLAFSRAARLGQNKLKATPAPRLSTHAAQGPHRAKTLLALLSLGPRARAKKRSGVGGVAAALCSLQQLYPSANVYIPFGARFPAPAGARARRGEWAIALFASQMSA